VDERYFALWKMNADILVKLRSINSICGIMLITTQLNFFFFLNSKNQGHNEALTMEVNGAHC